MAGSIWLQRQADAYATVVIETAATLAVSLYQVVAILHIFV